MKLLLSLLALGKLGSVMTTGGTMIISVFAYALFFGWQYALGFVLLLFVHEMGHFWAARARGLDLVRVDLSGVVNKYIGETEKRIRKVFQVAEGLAPCVLWIDELEKVFAGSGSDSASADAGVSSSLVHYHFDTREELLAEALAWSYEHVGTQRADAQDKPTKK